MRLLKVLTVLLSAGALAVTGCGGKESSGGAKKKKGNDVDRGFIADMVPHHMLGVEMATLAQERGESAFVKQLAEDIVRTQNEEIDIMKHEDETLVAEGIEQASLDVPEHTASMRGDLAKLRTTKAFDRDFIKMMIPHHAGAIALAKVQISRGKARTLKMLARSMIKMQQREIDEMRKHLGGRAGKGAGAAHGGGHSG